MGIGAPCFENQKRPKEPIDSPIIGNSTQPASLVAQGVAKLALWCSGVVLDLFFTGWVGFAWTLENSLRNQVTPVDYLEVAAFIRRSLVKCHS